MNDELLTNIFKGSEVSKVPRFQGSKVPRFQGSKVSRFQGFFFIKKYFIKYSSIFQSIPEKSTRVQVKVFLKKSTRVRVKVQILCTFTRTLYLSTEYSQVWCIALYTGKLEAHFRRTTFCEL